MNMERSGLPYNPKYGTADRYSKELWALVVFGNLEAIKDFEVTELPESEEIRNAELNIDAAF